ncbi:unnamed protein product [Paramecium pentaurelia]|uniref:Transmembrane protein n=1 Tax=Paramecium pentaurelia TaxID=43138 RepID=A0A8S1UQC9_9CILI|nr:unnamed protein product [Paramecium pentaurelia]
MAQTNQSINFILQHMEETEYQTSNNKKFQKFYGHTSFLKLFKGQLEFVINFLKVRRDYEKIKKQKDQYAVCFGIINLISLLIFYLLWIYSIKYPSEDLYDQFILNQSQGIIEDIISLDTSYQCPSQYEPLFNYQWPGTFVGCDCTQNLPSKSTFNITELTNNFHKYKQCDQHELDKGCKQLYEIQEKKLTLLNDNNYSKPFLLCAKRNQNISLRYNFTYCQLINKTICGSGVLTYCLPPEVECPISEIGFTSDLNYQNLKLKNDPKYGKIFNVSNQLQFYYTKNQSLIPISQVQITETENICKLNSENNISPNRSDYYLMKIQRQPCQEYDSQFKKVYQINEDQFYLANNLLVLNRSLTYFKVNSSVIWTLRIKSYAQIKENCQYGSEEVISDYENFIRKIDLQNVKTQRYINQFLIIPILLLILNFIPYLFKYIIVKLLKIFQQQSKENIFYNVIQRIFQISIHITILSFLLLDQVKWDQYQENYINFINSQCIVTELASSIYDFDQLEYSKGFEIFKIILIFVAQSIFILYYFLCCLCGPLPNCCRDRNNLSQVYPFDFKQNQQEKSQGLPEAQEQNQNRQDFVINYHTRVNQIAPEQGSSQQSENS